jgi:predicted DNA binding protein
VEGKGQRLERETVITFNEADSSASVWTSSETVYRRLKKLGYVPTQDNERSAVFDVPKAVVRVLKPRVKRELTERQREALKKSYSSSKALDIIQGNGHEIADG